MSGVAVGVDVGGTKIAAAAVDDRGQVLSLHRRESPASDPDAIVDAIHDLVAALGREHEVTCAGVAVAAFVDSERASVRYAANLAWDAVPLRSVLEGRLEVPVVVENDANAAAWGEFAFGAGEDVANLLMVTVGTGVGGGIVLDGELVRGGFGTAAEIGHIRVVPGGRRCGCGNLGCWEQYASGTALVRDAREAARSDPAAADLLARVDGRPELLTGPMLTDAAESGDAFALERLSRLGEWLGEGLATLVAVLDPEVIVVGGGVAAAGDLLLDPLRAAFRAHLTGAGHRPEAQIRPARLGNHAGVIGAADLARRAFAPDLDRA